MQISEDADRQAPKSQQNSKSVKMLTGERRKSQQNGVTSENADRQAQKSQQNSVISKNADLKIYMKREMRDNK